MPSPSSLQKSPLNFSPLNQKVISLEEIWSFLDASPQTSIEKLQDNLREKLFSEEETLRGLYKQRSVVIANTGEEALYRQTTPRVRELERELNQIKAYLAFLRLQKELQEIEDKTHQNINQIKI